MPHLNMVFEELGMKYGEREVLEKILKSSRKAAQVLVLKNTTGRAEQRKRKAAVAPKPSLKRPKVRSKR